MGHRSRCVDHEPDLTAMDPTADGVYAPCARCGAQLIADGPYAVGAEPHVQRGPKGPPEKDWWSVVKRDVLIAIAPNARDAQLIAGLLNFTHKDA